MDFSKYLNVAARRLDYEELYGVHKLSGVDILEDASEDEDKGRRCLFIIDGVTFEGEEDPDDGYRSYMGWICVSPHSKVKNTFDDELVVICGYDSWDKRGHKISNGIQILNAYTGEPILILGTIDFDDYYPACRMEYTPENLSANRRKD